MSLTAALIFNVLAMLALLGGLAYVMSAPKRLEPQQSGKEAELLRMRQDESDTEERAAA